MDCPTPPHLHQIFYIGKFCPTKNTKDKVRPPSENTVGDLNRCSLITIAICFHGSLLQEVIFLFWIECLKRFRNKTIGDCVRFCRYFNCAIDCYFTVRI